METRYRTASEPLAAVDALRVLADAGEALAASLDYQQTLANVSKILVPQLADYCIVYKGRTAEDLRRVCLYHSDPDKAVILERLDDLPFDRPTLEMIGSVLARQESLRVPRLSASDIQRAITDSKREVLIRELKPTSFVMAPLSVGGRAIGAINLVRSDPERPFQKSEMPLIDELARRAALAIDHAELYGRAQKAETRLQVFVQSGILGIVYSAFDGRIVEANDQFLQMTGYSREDLLSGNVRWDEMTPPEHAHLNQRAIAEMQATGRTTPFEKDYIRKDGSRVPVLLTSVMLPDGPPDSMTLVMDVSERQRLQRSQEFLLQVSTILSESLDYQTTLKSLAKLAVPEFADWCALDLLNPDGGLDRVSVEHIDPEKVRWAKEIQEKYPPDPDAPQGLWNVIRTGKPELYTDIAPEMIEAVAKNEEHLQIIREAEIRSAMILPLLSRGQVLGALTLVSSKGGFYREPELHLFELVARRAAIAVDNARLYTAAQEELDARRRTEVELRVSEERFRTMANRAPVLIWIAGPDKLVNWFNKPWLDFTGRSLEEELGDGWMQGVHADDYDRCLKTFSEAFDRREVLQVEYRLRRHDGEYRWMADHGIPQFDADGAFTGYIGSCIDVTERVEAQEELERRVAARTAELANAYNQLESFSYSVSHDLRQPLRSINMANATLLADYGDKLDEAGQNELRRTAAATIRMSQLIDDLLEYARLGTKEVRREWLSLSDLARSVGQELIAATDSESPVELEVQNGMSAYVDQVLLRVALQNLLENAIKFSKKRPGAKVEVSRVEGSDDTFFVRDNGVGFDQAFANKLFLPFERLHDAREFPGTGIGLANVKRIIERHNGQIWAEGEVGKGATFFFTLPA